MKVEEPALVKVFEDLDLALSLVEVPTGIKDKTRSARASEFMLMNEPSAAVLAFKHKGTRNYIYLDQGTRILRLGDGRRYFQSWDFGPGPVERPPNSRLALEVPGARFILLNDRKALRLVTDYGDDVTEVSCHTELDKAYNDLWTQLGEFLAWNEKHVACFDGLVDAPEEGLTRVELRELLADRMSNLQSFQALSRLFENRLVTTESVEGKTRFFLSEQGKTAAQVRRCVRERGRTEPEEVRTL